MKFTFKLILFVFSFLTFVGCKKSENLNVKESTNSKNAIEYASSLSINQYEGYSIVTVSNPWPEANKNFTYILKEKNGSIPDNLQKYTTIQVPGGLPSYRLCFF
jgi:iron complex transport system substrate-binding protein